MTQRSTGKSLKQSKTLTQLRPCQTNLRYWKMRTCICAQLTTTYRNKLELSIRNFNGRSQIWAGEILLEAIKIQLPRNLNLTSIIWSKSTLNSKRKSVFSWWKSKNCKQSAVTSSKKVKTCIQLRKSIKCTVKRQKQNKTSLLSLTHWKRTLIDQTNKSSDLSKTLMDWSKRQIQLWINKNFRVKRDKHQWN